MDLQAFQALLCLESFSTLSAPRQVEHFYTIRKELVMSSKWFVTFEGDDSNLTCFFLFQFVS